MEAVIVILVILLFVYVFVVFSACFAEEAFWPIAWPIYTLDLIIREFWTAIKYCFRKEE